MNRMVQLFELIRRPKLVAIWQFFLQQPDKEFSQTGVLKQTKIAKATAVKWLRVLVEEKVLAVQPKGPAKYYRLTANPVNKLLKTAATVAALLPLSALPGEVYLFGSTARGEDTEKSDIDLLVIGKVSKHDVLRTSGPLAKQLKRLIKPIVMTPMEWAAMKTKDPAFYERVEKDKIRITWI